MDLNNNGETGGTSAKAKQAVKPVLQLKPSNQDLNLSKSNSIDFDADNYVPQVKF